MLSLLSFGNDGSLFVQIKCLKPEGTFPCFESGRENLPPEFLPSEFNVFLTVTVSL